MDDLALHTRQILYGPDHSCELKIAADATERLGSDLRARTGGPATIVLLRDQTVQGALLEEVFSSCTSAGFLVKQQSAEEFLGVPAARETTSLEDNPSFEAISLLLQSLVQEKIGGSDALVALGTETTLTLAGAAATLMQGGVTCAFVPTTFSALIKTPALSAAFSVKGVARAVQIPLNVSFVLANPRFLAGIRAPYAAALMVKAAFIDAQKSWEDFMGVIDALAAGDEACWFEGAATAAKRFSFLTNAGALAKRQSLAYGTLFAATFRRLFEGTTEALLLGESMRFSAQLACTQEKLRLKTMIEQEAALDALGVPKLARAQQGAQAFEAAAATFVEAVKKEQRLYSRRRLYALPYAAGRIVYTELSDAFLKDQFERFLEQRT